MKKSTDRRKWELPCWGWAFFLNLAVALAAIAPMLAKNHGYLAMSHDFSAQEIPFQILMNDAVKSGNLLWNWGIDLGGNFLESFGFYNVGSVFFWLTLPFPAKALPRVMGWMILLKYAVAGASSAAYFSRHIRRRTLVLFASLLYTFSGFQCGTVVFYHFQDPVAFFPFLLIGLEQLVEEGKRGRLALACALNLLCNYVFFAGEVLFLAVYYTMKYLVPRRKSLREHVRPLACCALEGGIGALASGALLLPSLCGILANSRLSNHILGENWFTVSSRDWLLLLKAMLMPAEAMNRMSSVTGADWMGNAAYLPMVGPLLALAYAFSRKDWISGLLKFCLAVAVVPVLNSAFMFFNEEPYRRWYYMGILILALASAKVLEDWKAYRVRKAAVCLAALYGLFWGMLSLVQWDAAGSELIFQRGWFWFGFAFGAGGAALALLILKLARGPEQGRLLCAGTAFWSGIALAAAVYQYASTTDNTNLDFKTYPNSYGENVYHYLTEVPGMLDREVLPYRYYFDEWIGYTYYNLAMANSLPSINSFISTAHPSVMEFYDLLGLGRRTWTNADNTGTRELLSAKYIVSVVRQEEYEPVAELSNSNGQVLYLYENTDALPIGFTYNHYITRSEFASLDVPLRATAMLGTLVVRDQDAEKAARVIPHAPEGFLAGLAQEQRGDFLAERRRECSESFRQGDNRFEVRILADADKYAFFSVPYDRAWRVWVNGQEREILNVNGLMAVRVDAGENAISFRYEYAPLRYGILSSIAGIAAYGVYMAFGNRKKTLPASGD